MSTTTLVNRCAVGNFLQASFAASYSKLFNTDYDKISSSELQSIKAAIIHAYKSIHVNIDFNSFKSSTLFQVGDIISFQNYGKQRYYVIVGMEDDKIFTFPSLNTTDSKLLNTTTTNIFYSVLKPNYDNIDINQIDQKLKTSINKQLVQKYYTNEGTFIPTHINLPDSAFQIGDIVIAVDPIQISFMTQNGYQYYPTLRTQGNPIIPSAQQIKNITVTLIFPNEDCINNQLLNIYAMYKRTPFVNIRNKDICDFFEDIKIGKSEYISVALESINIQSVDGFPNTLQATLTLLPFDPRVISNGLRALRSISDVEGQAALLDPSEKEYQKAAEKLKTSLYDNSPLPNTIDEISPKLIRYTDDFRESLPFRAFYQSMIGDRKYVQDEYGDVVTVRDINGLTLANGYEINKFKPTKDYNLLHTYKSGDNRKPISLKYTYLEDDYRNLVKSVSESRITNQEDLARKLKDTISLFDTKDNMIGSILTKTLSFKDYIAETEFSWNKADNALKDLLVMNGISVDSQPVDHNLASSAPVGNSIKTLFKFLFEGISRKIPTYDVSIALKNLQTISTNDKKIFQDDYLSLLNQFYFQGADEFQTGTGTMGLQTLIDNIWKWLNASETNKISFAQFLENWTESLKNDLDTGIFITDVTSNASDISGKRIYRLPISQASVDIDFTTDIIQTWNIVFANKFIPITIQAFKYPIYQHMGSENANITLNIISTGNHNGSTIGTKLSLLSDRLLDSARVLMLSCPDLITWLDPRITIDSEEHNIFKVFGLGKVVYNSSNITNIQGQPNNWNVVLNLTQANISLSDYHNVQQESNNNQLNEELAKFIGSLRLNDNGTIDVLDYYQTINGVQTLITNFDDVVKYSFCFSKYMPLLYQSMINTQSTALSNPDRVSSKQMYIINQFNSAGLGYSVNAESTSRLHALCSSIPDFNKALKFVISKVDDMQQKELDFMKVLIAPKETVIHQIFHNPIKALITLFTETASTIGNVLNITPKETADMKSISDIRVQLSDKLKELSDGYKKTVILSLSKTITKDPIILSNLLSSNILSNTFKDNILKNQLNVSSCYSDFDMPTFAQDANGSPIILSPDFYLYGPSIVDKDLYEYTNDSLDTILSVDHLSQMLCLTDFESNINKYSEIRTKLSGLVDQKNMDEIDTTLNYKTDIVSTLQDIRKQYFQVTLNKDAVLSKDDSAKIRAELNSLDSDPRLIGHPDQLAAVKSYYEIVLKARGDSEPVDSDNFKIQMIKAARIGTIVEVLELYVAINEFLSSAVSSQPKQFNYEGIINSFATQSTIKSKFESLFTGANVDRDSQAATRQSLAKISSRIKTILSNPTSKDLTLVSDIKFQKGIALGNNDKQGISDKARYTMLPELQVIESYVYNKIGALIRMNIFMDYVQRNAGTKVTVSSFVPEYAFLDYWNWQQKESNDRRIDLVRQLNESTPSRNTGFLKMFPTFKIYFVEENKGFQFEFNNYFSYNAVQSIEIIKQKNSSGNTAVIRLSNLVGNLTDRFSFMREQIDSLSTLYPNQENIKFLGTLNIKPGTRVIVDMGYAANDHELKTVFIGKIVEMNAGPNVEMVCQSYGAQLQYEIPKMHFNIWSREKAYGEIASAILDKIPELERFGKMDLFNTSLTSFTGKNIRNYRSNFYERFLLGNLFGRISSLTFAQDNPRDENIYLPYDLVLDSLHHPSFDWIIYNQTVWQALQELCLYNDNAIPLVKIYNDDVISNKNDLRETLIIGNKAGYYKYTDAFGLSSLNFKQIDEAIKQFGSIKQSIRNQNTKNPVFVSVWKANDGRELTDKEYYDLYEKNTSRVFQYQQVFRLDPNLQNAFIFFQDELNTKVIMKYLLSKIHFDFQIGPDDVLETFTKQPTLVESGDILTKLLDAIVRFHAVGNIPNNDLPYHDFSDLDTWDSSRMKYFLKLIEFFKKASDVVDFNLSSENFYDVKQILENTNTDLITNLQYKKIQTHHLITDLRDIISNDIALNGTFSNVVNLYYFTEPSFKKANFDTLTEDQINDLNIWTVKSFGDIRDSSLRPLNSFQKNIDTNWFDIRNKMSSFYDRYRRIYNDDKNALKDYLGKTVNKDNPSWELFPSFVIVAVNLLKQEVAKMYQGTIDIVGNPDIEPYDIIHISDYVNDMHGAVEVEEVIHRFTPDGGFITTITPNLITYDRDPVQLQDIQVINDILNIADHRAMVERFSALIPSATLALAGARLGPTAGAITTALGAGLFLYAGVYGIEKKRQKFLYDQMGQILGRDCINFTTLIYHGLPYITGFDGVDYENLKTIIKHNVSGIKDPVTRLAAFWDPYEAGLIKGPADFNFIDVLTPSFLRFLPEKTSLNAGIFSN